MANDAWSKLGLMQRMRLRKRYLDYVACTQSKGKKAKTMEQWVNAGMPRCEK